jgi:hypothetical protein
VHGLFGVKETASGSSEILAEVAECGAVVFGLAAVILLLRSRVTTVRVSRAAGAS